MAVSYPYRIPTFFVPFVEKHGRRPVASDLTPEERSEAATCIGMNTASAYAAGEIPQADLALLQCVDESLKDPIPAPRPTGAVLVDVRELERKRDVIRKSLHTAWGQCKDSPSYQKCWWRVLATVLENLTCSTDPAAIKVLSDLTIPSDPERPN